MESRIGDYQSPKFSNQNGEIKGMEYSPSEIIVPEMVKGKIPTLLRIQNEHGRGHAGC